MVTLVSPAFYVATTGNDGNPGTAGSPFASLEQARTAMRNSSTKTTYVRAGTYNRTSSFTLTTADNSTSWLGYPGETAIFDGASTLIDAIYLDTGTTGVTLDNFTFQNMMKCAVHLAGYTNSPVTNTLISNSVFKNIVTDGQYGAGNGGAIRGTFATKNNTFRNNLFQDMFCPGVSLAAGSASELVQGNKIIYNRFLRMNRGQADTGSIYIMDRGHTGDVNNPNIIDHNYVEDSGDQTESKAFYLDDEASCVVVTNNIFCGTAHWLFQLHGSDHVTISNNVFDMSNPKWPADFYMGLYQDDVQSGFPNYGMGSNSFTNNIVYTSAVYQQNQMWQMNLTSGQSVTKPSVSNNIYYGAQGTLPATAGDIVDTNPKYLNPNFTSPSTRDYSFTSTANANQISFTPINQAAIGPQTSNVDTSGGGGSTGGGTGGSASDTFTGTNGAAWSANWSVTGTGANTISNNTGLSTTGSGGYNAQAAIYTGATAASSWDVYVTATPNAPTQESYVYFAPVSTGLGGYNSTAAYAVEVNVTGNSLQLSQILASQRTSVGGSVALPAGTTSGSFRIRAKYDSTAGALYAKVWATSTSEPTAWTTSSAVSPSLTGQPSIAWSNGASNGVQSARFDDFGTATTTVSATGTATLTGSGNLSATGVAATTARNGGTIGFGGSGTLAATGVSNTGAVAGGTVLAAETWTGTTGAGWPAQWTQLTEGGPAGYAATIQNNAGYLNPGTVGYSGVREALANVSASDFDTTITWTVANQSESYSALVANTDNTISSSNSFYPKNGYHLELGVNNTPSAGYIKLLRYAGDVSSTLINNVTATITASTAYRIRFKRASGVLSFKFWTLGNSEPTSWTGTATDASPLSGNSGFYLTSGNGGAGTAQPVTWDDLSITNGGVGYTGTAALSGAGTLAISTKIASSRTVSLSGSGTLASTLRITAGSTVALTGSGTLNAAGITGVANNAVTFSGAGTLSTSAVARLAIAGAAVLAGTGALAASGAALLTNNATPTLSGAGTLAVNGVVMVLVPVALVGAGTLSTGATITAASTVPLAGSGVLAASILATPLSAVAFTGSGTVTAFGTQGANVTTAFTGNGTLSYSATTYTNGVATVALGGVGTLNTGIVANAVGSVTMTGFGLLALTPTVKLSGATALSGSGTITTVSKAQLAQAVVLAGLGQLSTAGTSAVQTSVTLTGAGTLVAASKVTASAAVTMSGIGALSAAQRVMLATIAQLSGSGTLAINPKAAFAVAAPFVSEGVLSVSGVPLMTARAQVSLSGMGTLVYHRNRTMYDALIYQDHVINKVYIGAQRVDAMYLNKLRLLLV